MKHLWGLVTMGESLLEPPEWAIVQRWLAGCVASGRVVIRYPSGVLADVASVAQAGSADLAGGVIEIYDRDLAVTFHRLRDDPR